VKSRFLVAAPSQRSPSGPKEARALSRQPSFAGALQVARYGALTTVTAARMANVSRPLPGSGKSLRVRALPVFGSRSRSRGDISPGRPDSYVCGRAGENDIWLRLQTQRAVLDSLHAAGPGFGWSFDGSRLAWSTPRKMSGPTEGEKKTQIDSVLFWAGRQGDEPCSRFAEIRGGGVQTRCSSTTWVAWCLNTRSAM